MRTVTLSPKRASRAPVSHTISCHTDGNVTIRTHAPKPASSVRCVGCVHFCADPSTRPMGYERYSCRLGHLRRDGGGFRWFTDAEIRKPSQLLAAVARGCTDRQTSAA